MMAMTGEVVRIDSIQLPRPYCPSCHRYASEIEGLAEFAAEDGYRGPDAYIQAEEGSYNTRNGHFLCDGCFFAEEDRLGRKLVGPDGGRWVCP